jgi:hypothetical protein
VCVRLLSWGLGFFEICICVGLLTFLGFMVLRALGLFVRLLTFLAFRVLRALRLFMCVFSLFFLGLGFDELCVICSFCHLSVTLTPLLNVVVSNQAF